MRLDRARRSLVLLVSALVGVGPAAAQAPNHAVTVETLAGPGFCVGPTVTDAAPSRVGALAVDEQGRIYTDMVDAPGSGVVRAVDGTRVTHLRSNEPASPSADPLRSVTSSPAASRLAGGDGGAGVVVAGGTRVVEVDADPPSLRVVAGTRPGVPADLAPARSGDGGLAAEARFASARSVTADASHNLYVADQVDAGTATFVVRFINRSTQPVVFYGGTQQELAVAPGHIQTIAGEPGPAPTGDGGPARSATLQGVPPSLAVVDDRLYVASYWNRDGSPAPTGSVRLVNLGGAPFMAHGVDLGPGMIETVAGAAGSPVPGGGGGKARYEPISYVPGLAADGAGGLYLAEQLQNRVRFLDATGAITTFAGTSDARASLRGGGLDRPAAEAVLDRPVDVKIGGGRRVFIADEGSGRVLFVDSAGMIRLAAGSGRATRCAETAESSAAGGEQPAMGQPYSVVAGERGDIYFVNLLARRVMRRDSAGRTTLLLAAGDSCPRVGACTPATATELRWPAALAFAQHGLYVYDVIGARVFFLNLGDQPERVLSIVVEPGQLAVIVGNGTGGSGGDGGPAIAAQLGGQVASGAGTMPEPPSILLTEGAVGDIAVGGQGDLYIGDGANRRVRHVDGNGTITTVAGVGGPESAQNCCTKPSGLAIDAFGNVYVSDMETRQIWLLNRSNVAVEVHGRTVPAAGARPIAGTGQRGIGADGPGREISLYQPTGLVADGRGNLYIAEYHDQTVRRLDTSGLLTTVAGTGAGGFNGDGLPSRQAALFNPTDVALDPCGNLLVADFRNDRIRLINLVPPCDAASRASERTSSGARGQLIVGVGAAVALTGGIGIALWRRRVAVAPNRRRKPFSRNLVGAVLQHQPPRRLLSNPPEDPRDPGVGEI